MIIQRDASDRDLVEPNVPEKILRVQDLWDQIADTPDDFELTDAQSIELERRLLAHEKNPGPYISWDDLRRELLKKAR